MRIEVEKLTGPGEEFAHAYAEGELLLYEDAARLRGGTTVSGRASRKGDEVRLSGRIRAEVEVACDRCLRPVVLPLELEFKESFTPLSAEPGRGEETVLQAADLNFSVYEGDSVDVDDLVREQVLLALPARAVCTEQCQGLCPECGADLNAETCSCPGDETDPRWAGLAELKKDSKP